MIDPDRPVRVFRNWKHHCYSIMQGGVVRASARQVLLADVQFVVRESGRQRMIAEQRKNVHAYAVGRLVDHVHPHDTRDLQRLDGRPLTYDAYRDASFVDADDGSAVWQADSVLLHERGVTYAGGGRDDDTPLAA